MSTDKAMVTDADLIKRLVIPMVQERSREPNDAWAQAASALAALAQAEQPVAWLKRKSKKPLEPIEYETCEPGRVASFPVYAHPPAKREAGEIPAPVQHVVARPLSDWHEVHGFVTWWKFPVNEPSYIGSPLCEDWPGYHTHWTPHPEIPANANAIAATEGSDNA